VTFVVQFLDNKLIYVQSQSLVTKIRFWRVLKESWSYKCHVQRHSHHFV